jgi:hypothetical protein
VVVGDFNHDGKPDFAIADAPDTSNNGVMVTTAFRSCWGTGMERFVREKSTRYIWQVH